MTNETYDLQGTRTGKKVHINVSGSRWSACGEHKGYIVKRNLDLAEALKLSNCQPCIHNTSR